MTFSFFLIIYSANSQSHPDGVISPAGVGAASISATDLNRHVLVLASDSLEGRETGEPGQKKAARYISDQFRMFGLKPVTIGEIETYRQEFSLPGRKKALISLMADGVEYQEYSDFIQTGRFQDGDTDTVEIIFAGFGVQEALENAKSSGRGIMFLSTYDDMSLQNRIKAAVDLDFNYIFIVWESDSGFDQLSEIYRSTMGDSRIFMDRQIKKGHIFIVSNSMGCRLLGASSTRLKKLAGRSLGRTGNRTLKPFRRLKVPAAVINALPSDSLNKTENILGYIPGRKYPGECIVISAHYDHLGRRGEDVYFGADDNASGTAALLELAEGFSLAAAKGFVPDRSILFIAFSGEEKGLLGSQHYTDHPVFPLEKTQLNLNIDMIGRRDTLHENEPDYIYLIGSDKISPDLHRISESANSRYTSLTLDYTYNRDEDPNRFFYRSDQYNFAKYNIPVIFYFTGVHEDYHKPSDTAEKIGYEKMVKITELIWYTAWEVANLQQSLKKVDGH